MVKADMDCDYYGDLEISSTADDAEVKKAYKKLAIKYHPDRNPGREEEITPRFQAIQAAYEVLTDPEQRRKYDVGRRLGTRPSQSAQPTYSNKNAYASESRSYGQKGNPWANAGSQWAPPPKPPTARAPPPSAGAKRYSHFAREVPVPPRKTADSGAEERRANYSAWEGMRRQAPTATKPPPPPRPADPPRTKYPVPPRPGFEDFVKQSTEDLRRSASQKKNGYMPSTSGGDEPAAASSGAYYTRSNRPVPPPPDTRPVPPPPPPASTRPNRPSTQAPFDTTPAMPSPDEYRRTPYTTQGGEKTNPFEGLNSDHTRNTNFADQDMNGEPATTQTAQSQHSNVSKAEEKYTPMPQKNSTAQDDSTSSEDSDPSIRVRKFAKPRKRSTKKGFMFSPGSYSESIGKPSSQYGSPYSPTRVSSTPLYSWNPSPTSGTTCKSYKLPSPGRHFLYSGPIDITSKCSESYSSPNFSRKPPSGSYTSSQGEDPVSIISSSGDQHFALTSNAFEQTQYDVLHRIISNAERAHSSGVTSTSPKRSWQNDGQDDLPYQTTVRSPAALASSRTEPIGQLLKDTKAMRSKSFGTLEVKMDVLNTSFPNDSSTQSHLISSKLAKANIRIASVSSDADGSASSSVPNKTFTSSAENITTAFSPTDWDGKFSAGECFLPGQSGRGPTRSSQQKQNSIPRPAGLDPDTLTEDVVDKNSRSASPAKFTAEEWAQTFKPQVFAPPNLPSSPGVSSRMRSARRTRTGSAARIPSRVGAVLIDEESPDEGKPLFGEIPHESPTEMDIDSPVVQPQAFNRKPRTSQASSSEARNVPVEPLRADWRAGDHGSRHTSPVRLDDGIPPMPPPKISETPPIMADTNNVDDNLNTNLEDLRTTEPFQTPARGLNSFEDLGSTLPFPSGTSNGPQPPSEFATKRLNLPQPPKAPVLPVIATDASRPSAASWESYLLAFKAYMAEYDLFSTDILNHFTARKQQVQTFRPGWLEAFGDTGLAKYTEGLREDVIVREWWAEAAARHETAVGDFTWVKAVYRDGLKNHVRD